ncbi:MAG: EVE domain-containing protein [Gemmatimonadaceae bacterium]
MTAAAPVTATAIRRYWLLKTEPGCFSYDDLLAAPHQTTHWSGVRNYQARNLMRDEMKQGDGVLFYYSSANPPGIVGTAEIARAGYPDFTAWDADDEHFDQKSTKSNPVWYMVDVRAGRRFDNFLALGDLRHMRALEGMELLKRGSRLSVQRVTEGEWQAICKMGGF